MQNTRNIRFNTDLSYVMFHHSEHFIPIKGIEINKSFVQNGYFGLPQDIVINANGQIDITPRWIRGMTPSQYVESVDVSTIFSYTIHDVADICSEQQMNYQALHLLIVGNFDKKIPTIAQINSINSILNQIRKNVPTIINVIYHSDIITTSCPGTNFPNKNIFQSILLDTPGEFNGIGNNPLNIQPLYPKFSYLLAIQLVSNSHSGVQFSWVKIYTPPNLSIVKYNIYRQAYGTDSVQFYDSTTNLSYTDTSIVVGNKYTYYVTTVLSNGDESALSNPLIITVVF